LKFELNLKEVLGVSASSSVVRNPVDVSDDAKTMNEMHVLLMFCCFRVVNDGWIGSFLNTRP